MYSTYFVNNKTYGADDINTVLARLTTQGVSLFKDTGNALIDIETAISSFVDAGVELYNTEGCKVVALDNGKFKITKGCCWMPSGACIIFDDEGYVFTPNFVTESGASSSRCYIYLRQGGAESNSESNEINIIVSPEKYGDDDVPIAYISGSRVITDNRIFAQSKVAVPTANIVQENELTLLEESEKTITPPYPGFSYIIMLNHTNSNNSSGGKPYLLTEEKTYIGANSGINIYAYRNGSQVTFVTSQANSDADSCTLKYMLF